MQPIHFSWHIVIYIIIIYHVPCGRTNILVSVYFVCRVSTSQNEGWEGGEGGGLLSEFMDHHTGFVAVDDSERQL